MCRSSVTQPYNMHVLKRALTDDRSDRSTNLMKWNCHIPGKPNTDWEGGYFPLTMEFSEEYPAKPPKVCNVGVCIMFINRTWEKVSPA